MKRIYVILTLATIILILFISVYSSAAAEKYVLFILDTSNSMNGKKISYAKKTLLQALRKKPTGTDIALRVFNQKPHSLKESCSGSELVLDFDNYSVEELKNTLDSLNIYWQTPLEQTLIESQHDFFIDNKIHEIIIITDGDDTCGGAPCDRASYLRKNYGIVINVIAVRIDNEKTEESLTCIAEKSDGKYFNVKNHDDISKVTFELLGLPTSPLVVILEDRAGSKVKGKVEIYDEMLELVANTEEPLREFSPSLPIGKYTVYAYVGAMRQKKTNVVVKEDEPTKIVFVFEPQKK